MLTPEQRELRRDRVGSSDAPAIVGVDPWRTAADVFVEKVFDLDDADSKAIRFGNMFEAPLIAWAAEELGFGDVECNVGVEHRNGVLASNLDGLVRRHRALIEAKTTGQADLWGEEGTDQIPERVIVQSLHQVDCCLNAAEPIEVDVVWVPVLYARFDRPTLALYKVAPDGRLQEAISRSGVDFWHNYVLPRRPPTSLLPSIDVLSRIKRVPKKTVSVSPKLVDDFEQAKEARKTAEAAEEIAKRALLAAVGDAEAADFGHPREHYTYFEQSRAGVNVSKLRATRPEIFAAFDSTSYFRVLRRSKR